MTELEMQSFEENINELRQENISLNISTTFNDTDGIYIWEFSSYLEKLVFDDADECHEKSVVSQSGGYIIPSNMDFDYTVYSSQKELCDSISGDLLTAYTAVADYEGNIKRNILNDVGLDEDEVIDTGIAIIEDISYIELRYLRKYLNLFDVFIEGLPVRNCRLVVVLFNWDRESESIKLFLDYGWRIKSVDYGAAVAYRNI